MLGSGDTPGWYTYPRLATRYRRIQVTRTPELSEALGRGAAILGNKLPESRLVAELAIRGAELLASQHERKEALKRKLIAQLRDPDGFDRKALAEVRSFYGKR